MSLRELQIAIGGVLRNAAPANDGAEARAAALFRSLETVWPVLEELAENLALAAHLPLIVFLGAHRVYSSQEAILPRWCSLLNGHPQLGNRCTADEQKRATKGATQSVCHAGMLISQRRISIFGLTEITILFGARWALSPTAKKARESFLQSIQDTFPETHSELVAIAATQDNANTKETNTDDMRIMDSIQQTLGVMIESTINSHIRTVNMAHEVTMILQGTSALVTDVVEEIRGLGQTGVISNDFAANADVVEAEYECALYVLQNFLSSAGHLQYRHSWPKAVEEINPAAIFARLIHIYSRTERGQKLQFIDDLPEPCPTIIGQRLELTRAFHNVMSNAVKYSYITTPDGAERRVRVYARIPYGDRGQRSLWAICVENYGVGLQEDEQYFAFQVGFRGRHGIEQTGVGAGIGLSEVQKIMATHDGRARIRSKFLHRGRRGDVYLTTVSLIFPIR